MEHVHTHQQIADVFTKGSFTRDKLSDLILFGIVPESCHRSPFLVVAMLMLLAQQMTKPQSAKARHQSQFKRERELSRWPQCDIREANF